MSSTVTSIPARWRTAVASGTAGVALLYLIVGLEFVEVDGIADVEPGPAVPLVIAGALFAALAVTLVVLPRPIVFAAGAALQVLVLVLYVAVAPNRDPAFEPWGMAIEALELLLLIGYLRLLTLSRDSAGRAPGPELTGSWR